MVDALIDGRPGVHPVPPMPKPGGFPGRYLNRDTGATVDVSLDEAGRIIACTYGGAFATIPTDDGRLATSRGSADFAMRLLSEDVLEVERDAGEHETLQRVSGNAALPADLPGRYCNPDTAAVWTISDGNPTMTLRVAGPLRSAITWEVEPIAGDCIRVIAPSPMLRSWFDCRVLRDSEGRVTGLRVDGSRARNLLFTRERI
jgi:hypothetical protein